MSKADLDLSFPGQNYDQPKLNLLKSLIIEKLLANLNSKTPQARNHIHSLEEDFGIDEFALSPFDIIWNLEKVSRSGIVMSDSASSLDLQPPSKVVSAMKTLASLNRFDKFPYDNYAADIFGQVYSYYFDKFVGLDRGNGPLLTFELNELILAILDMIDSADETMQVGVGYTLDSKVAQAFSLGLLLLPPNNRRQMHLLLRLVSKMCLNPEVYGSVVPKAFKGEKSSTKSEDLKLFLRTG